MRGFVERLEMLERDAPEGVEITADDVAESYLADADNARDSEDG
jgi:hypothetical protein